VRRETHKAGWQHGEGGEGLNGLLGGGGGEKGILATRQNKKVVRTLNFFNHSPRKATGHMRVGRQQLERDESGNEKKRTEVDIHA